MAQKAPARACLLILLLAPGAIGAAAAVKVDIQDDTVLLQLDTNATEAPKLSAQRKVPGGSWAPYASGKVCEENTETLSGQAGSSLEKCKSAVAIDPACGIYLMYEPFQQSCFCMLPAETTCTLFTHPSLASYSVHKYTPPPPTRSAGAGAAAAKGDPHMVNIHGQRFDLMRTGSSTLVHIPRYAKPVNTLFDVTVDVERIGADCTDMYMQSINVTGLWASIAPGGGLFFSVKHPRKNASWQEVGKVSIKVIHGVTKEGINYLNFLIRDLSKVAVPIGGLLGEDDHTAASQADPSCAHRTMSLIQRTV